MPATFQRLCHGNPRPPHLLKNPALLKLNLSSSVLCGVSGVGALWLLLTFRPGVRSGFRLGLGKSFRGAGPLETKGSGSGLLSPGRCLGDLCFCFCSPKCALRPVRAHITAHPVGSATHTKKLEWRGRPVSRRCPTIASGWKQ